MSKAFTAPESNEMFSSWQLYHVVWVNQYFRPTPLTSSRVQNPGDGYGVRISLWNVGVFEHLVWLSQEGSIGPYMAVWLRITQLFLRFGDWCYKFELSHMISITVYIASRSLSSCWISFVSISVYPPSSI